MRTNTRERAWAIANEVFPTDYMKNEARSQRAGYDIYESTAEGILAWISDLGDRLEVNLENGTTITIWINEKPKFKEWQIEDALEVIDRAIYRIDDIVEDRLAKETGIAKARETLYEAYGEIAKILKEQYPESSLFERYNLGVRKVRQGATPLPEKSSAPTGQTQEDTKTSGKKKIPEGIFFL